MNKKSKKYIEQCLKETRKRLGITQEAMSERLHITPRDYGDLERGKHGLSGDTLVNFLILLSDEALLKVVGDLREKSNNTDDEDGKDE